MQDKECNSKECNSDQFERALAAVMSIRAAAVKARRTPRPLPPMCRICFEESGDFMQPCNCRGTQAFVHNRCVWQWRLRFSQTDGRYTSCGVCLGEYTDNIVPDGMAIYRPVTTPWPRCMLERWVTLVFVLMTNFGLMLWVCVEFHVLWRPPVYIYPLHPLKYSLLVLHCVNYSAISFLPLFDRNMPETKKKMAFGGIGLVGLVAGWAALWYNVPAFMYGMTAAGGMFVIPYLFVTVCCPRDRAILPL